MGDCSIESRFHLTRAEKGAFSILAGNFSQDSLSGSASFRCVSLLRSQGAFTRPSLFRKAHHMFLET